MQEIEIEASQTVVDCSVIEDTTKKVSDQRFRKKKYHKKAQDQNKVPRDTQAEMIFSTFISGLIERYPEAAESSFHPVTLTTLKECNLQLLQCQSGVYFFSMSRQSLLDRYPPVLGPVLVPSCSSNSNLFKKAILAVSNTTQRTNSSLLSIICPTSRKILRRLFTVEPLYNANTVCFSSGRLVSYLTKPLNVVSVPLGKMKKTVRPLKPSLQSYLDATLSTDALLSVNFEGLLVEWIKETELIILWGKWNTSPFICIFIKPQVALRFAVFDLLSAFTNTIKKVSLIPDSYLKRNPASTSSVLDQQILIYGRDKVSIHRLKRTTENRFADLDTPCFTLDHMCSCALP